MSSGSFRNPDPLDKSRPSEARLFTLWGRPTRLTWFTLALPLALSCAPSVSVKTSQDPGAKLSKYQSFAMLAPNKPVVSDNTKVDPFVMQRIRQLVYLGLKAKGYLPSNRGQADLLVNVHADVDTKYYAYSSPSYYGHYAPYSPRVGWNQDVWTVDENVVVVDLVDRREQAVVWRGTGVRTKEGELDEEQLKQIVAAILAQFPSRGGTLSGQEE